MADAVIRALIFALAIDGKIVKEVFYEPDSSRT